MSSFVRAACYADRATRASGLVEHAGWRLKRYDTTIDGSPIPDSYNQAEREALALLPAPAQTRDRPGVGFIIRHAGRTAHYYVLCWWDNQNELLQRLLVRDADAEAPWRDPQGRYSVCVWDLQVIRHERDAFVKHVMTPPDGPDLAAYLGDWFKSA